MNCVDEDRATMLASYAGLFPIHPRWYELPLVIRRSGLEQGAKPGEEHDARYAVRLYNDNLREYVLEYGEDCAEAREPTKHELYVAERVSVNRRGKIAQVKRIDARDEERHRKEA